MIKERTPTDLQSEQVVRGILDGGDRLNLTELQTEVSKIDSRITSTQISEALGRLLKGGMYDTAGGKYGRNGS